MMTSVAIIQRGKPADAFSIVARDPQPQSGRDSHSIKRKAARCEGRNWELTSLRRRAAYSRCLSTSDVMYRRLRMAQAP